MLFSVILFFKRVHRTSVEISIVQLVLLGSEGRAPGDQPAPFEINLDPIFPHDLIQEFHGVIA